VSTGVGPSVRHRRGKIKCMDVLSGARVDRSAFEVVSLDEEGDERAYWRSRSPEERMEALELMRQIIYGYDPATTRLQRVFEIAELE
jgi:hypothetical protein